MIKCRQTVVNTWATTLLRHPDLRQQVEKHWPQVWDKTDRVDRWKFVRGPIKALAATLRDIGWHAHGPLHWLDRQGDQWIVAGAVDDLGPIMEKVADDVDLQGWEEASKHGDGSGLGLAGGCWLEPTKNMLKQLAKQGKGLVSLATTILAGGCWPEARCSQAGYSEWQLQEMWGSTR